MIRFAHGLVLACLLGAAASAQGTSSFKARLGVVPVDAAILPTISGAGAVTAVLKGSTLVITGTFTGLRSPATVARVHVAPRGMRGPAAHDLTVTKAVSGSITAELPLTAAQVDHLRRGRLYIQLHSEKAPEGNLWGWLLP